MTLTSIFNTHTGRIIHKYDHYFPIYERHFLRFVGKQITFFEIGSGRGGSAQMWKQYFGSNARIVSLDINPDCAEFEEDQIHVRIGHQADAEFLDKVLNEFGAPDIVLDDGSHENDHMIATFGHLYDRTKDRGVYMVEDMHCCYLERYGGGVKAAGSFMEFAKDKIDELNGCHMNTGTHFTRTTLSMHFYPSVAVFERGSAGDTRVNRMKGAGIE